MSNITPAEVLDPSLAGPDGRIEHDEEEGFNLHHRGPLTPSTMEKIFADVLFVLPMYSTPAISISYLPNPQKRFCLDLRSPVDWFRSKRVRKSLKQFKLLVKCSLADDLSAAKAYHTAKSGDTWLTEDFIKQLHSLSLSRRDVVQCFSFSLVELSSNVVCATSFGFVSGRVYEDYTMATFVRDNRSCGHVLSLLVASVLQQAGIKLWYWGYENAYMGHYREYYGATELDRKSFYSVWRENAKEKPISFSNVTLPDGVALEIETPPSQRLVGTRVVISGIAAKQDLNGQVGEVISFDAERGRFAVKVGESGQLFLLKEANLACV